MKRLISLVTILLFTISTTQVSAWDRGGWDQGDIKVQQHAVDFDEKTGSIATPSTNHLIMFTQDKSGVSTLYTKDSVGVITEIGGGGSIYETDTLASVTARGATTATAMYIGALNSSGTINATAVTVDGSAVLTAEADTLDTVADRGSSTNQTLNASGLQVDGSAVLTSYTELDTLATVMARGNTTSTVMYIGNLNSNGTVNATAVTVDGVAVLTSCAETDTLARVCARGATATSIDVTEVFSSLGDFKIQPDVQGDIYMFGDTDVGDAVDSKIEYLYRKAVEGDSYVRRYINQFKWHRILLSSGNGMQIDTDYGPVSLQKNGAGAVELFSNSGNGENRNFEINGYNTATSAAKYTALNMGADGVFTVTAEDANVVGMDIQMPLTTDDATVEGTLTVNDISDADCMLIDNDGTGSGAKIQQDGVLASTKHALWIYSNTPQVTSPLALFEMKNASSDQVALAIEQAGSGPAIDMTVSGQIKFPATQVASADVNTLDDYEEGTWTPVYVALTTDFDSVTYDAATFGTYTKEGNTVHVRGQIKTDSITKGSASGVVQIQGLPFVVADNQVEVSVSYALNFLDDYPSSGVVLSGGSEIYLLYRTTPNGADSTLTIDDIGIAANNNNITFSLSYKV